MCSPGSRAGPWLRRVGIVLAAQGYYEHRRPIAKIAGKIRYRIGTVTSDTAAFALVYFTLATRVGRGRTPGKWLFGIRVIRLDGRPLSAGGYAASLSTAWMGFFEAARDPNGQAMHDRIAGTVVVRG